MIDTPVWDSPYESPPPPTAAKRPGDPGTYVGRDGNWYDEEGNNLGPSGQAPTPTQASGTGPGAPPGPAAPIPRPTAPGPEAPTPPPAPPNLGGGALAPYDVPAPQFPNEPAFQRRPDFSYADFQAPSVKDALNDPGYQFERDQSLDALQRWSAARGTLNDTGTATALMDVGRNAATQRLGDVWGRSFTAYNANRQNAFDAWDANEKTDERTYGINRQTQYIDPWTAAYNAWAQQGNFYLQNQGTVAGTALGFAQL